MKSFLKLIYILFSIIFITSAHCLEIPPCPVIKESDYATIRKIGVYYDRTRGIDWDAHEIGEDDPPGMIKKCEIDGQDFFLTIDYYTTYLYNQILEKKLFSPYQKSYHHWSKLATEAYWVSDKINYSCRNQGWKLHVGVTSESLNNMIWTLVPYFNLNKISYKIPRRKSILSQMSEGQTGKGITIYPSNDDQAVEIVKYINAIIKSLDLNEKDFTPAIYDAAIGPYYAVSTRYGLFSGSHLIKIDRNGQNKGVQRVRDKRHDSEKFAPDFVDWNPFLEAGLNLKFQNKEVKQNNLLRDKNN